MRWVLRHPVWTVVIVAVAARVGMAGLPLILTNDSVGYVNWGLECLRGTPTTIPPMRTPGYPLFLAGAFGVFGVGPVGVLLIQKILGVATAAIAAWAARRHSRPGVSLLVGLFFALWPTISCWESYLLTESLAIFLVVAGLAIALRKGGGPWNGLALGVVVGVGCLVRPSFLVPALALGLGWWVRAEHRARRRWIAGVALGFGLLLSTGPWLVFNASRGIYGLAGAEKIAFWFGMETAGALDDSFPLPEKIAEARARLRRVPHSEAAVFTFLEQTGAWHDRSVERVLGEWSGASVRARPGAYGRGVVRVFLSHLGVKANDLGWFVGRFGVDGRESGQAAWNMQVTDTAAWPEFRMEGGPTVSGRIMRWTSHRGVGRLIQVPLFLCGVIGFVVLLVRRDRGGAIIVAGMMAFFVLHAVMLLPSARLVMPAVAGWVVVAPIVWRGPRVAARIERHRGSNDRA